MARISLYYPAKPYNVNQPFGVDKATYSQFGLNGHNGVDLRASHGQPIYASHDGLAFYEVDSSQGHGVVVISDKPYDYNGTLAFFKTIYWHFCDPTKEPKFASPIYKTIGANSGRNLSVKAGDLLGYANSTGFSNGDHLHLGLKPIIAGKEPTSGDAPDVNIGAWQNVEQNNGFLGAIDPTPYFNGSYAIDSASVIQVLQSEVSLAQKIVTLLTSALKSH